jgi:hypothetical protein
MKTKIILLFIALGSTTFLSAQLPFNPRTGDAELDGVLRDIDKNAKNNLDFFAKDVVTKFSIAKSSIDKVIKIMPPGDIFMAAQISFLLGKPFEVVVNTYNVHKDKGWGVIAKEMGIKPGSPEFHNMKKALKSNGNSKVNGPGSSGNGKGNSSVKANDSGNGNGHGNKNSNGKGKKK